VELDMAEEVLQIPYRQAVHLLFVRSFIDPGAAGVKQKEFNLIHEHARVTSIISVFRHSAGFICCVEISKFPLDHRRSKRLKNIWLFRRICG